ncbi:unnamed protein product [Brassica rapa subsp. trilocularis]|uniref:(rape) hypothetical protein n=1 Tax=Brassica napus TaxID=3708 RepID=A0A816ZZ98_BRANA|nr:unnamed protein product [Brassica napus]
MAKKGPSVMHCGTKLVTRSETNHSFGTHHLQCHLKTCSKKPLKEAKPINKTRKV